MALHKPSEPWAMTAKQAAQRQGYAAKSELALRDGLEAFCRERWRDARIVHELVMGEGKVRADVVAIDRAHIAAFEVKGPFDDTTRLLHQVGMYQICVPEVWMVVAENHDDDAKLIRHLLPCLGLIIATGLNRNCYGRPTDEPFELNVVAEPDPRPVVPEMMLRMLWAAELKGACDRLRVMTGSRSTRPHMVSKLMQACSAEELMAETCRQLRGRDALWRADPPERAA